MDFKLFDADNHYYEAEDAFTRYGDERVKRYVRWVSEGKRRHIMFGDRVSTGVPNPTFNPIARPGAFHERLMELQGGSIWVAPRAGGGSEFAFSLPLARQ